VKSTSSPAFAFSHASSHCLMDGLRPVTHIAVRRDSTSVREDVRFPATARNAVRACWRIASCEGGIFFLRMRGLGLKSESEFGLLIDILE